MKKIWENIFISLILYNTFNQYHLLYKLQKQKQIVFAIALVEDKK